MEKLINEKINFEEGLEYQERSTAHGLIYNPQTNKFLVFEEISNPFVSVKYTLIGGGIEEGENAEQAFYREFTEETGLNSDSLKNTRYLGSAVHGWVFKSGEIEGYKYNLKQFQKYFYTEVISEKEGFEADHCITRWLSRAEITLDCGTTTKYLLENYSTLGL